MSRRPDPDAVDVEGMDLNPEGLTQKQLDFADNWLRTGKLKQSALDAGYSEKWAYQAAHENIRLPKVSRYIARHLAAFPSKVEVSPDFIMLASLFGLRKAMEDGDLQMLYKFNEQLGKHRHIQAFLQRHQHEHGGPGGGAIPVDVMAMATSLTSDERKTFLALSAKLGLPGADLPGGPAGGDTGGR